MACFFDTSAVVKRYMTEKGSGWVDHTLEKESPIWISKITLAEIYSVVGRRIRENTYPADDLSLFKKMFERHLRRDYWLVQVTNEVITLSQHLLLKHSCVRSIPYSWRQPLSPINVLHYSAKYTPHLRLRRCAPADSSRGRGSRAAQPKRPRIKPRCK